MKLKMSSPPITIIGAGLAGLTLGRCLKHKGIPAIIYERAPSSPRYGYGITLHSSTYQPLLSILEMDESTFRDQLAVDAAHNGNGNLSVGSLSSSSFRCHRGRLEQLLRESQEINWALTLKDLEISPQSQKITAVFENGKRVETQYLVGCDGPHSITRQSLAPALKLKVLPFVAFNGKRRFSHKAYMDNMHQYLQESVLIQARKGEVVLEISLNQYEASHVDVIYTFSRPAREGHDPLYKPDRKISGATDIPEEFYEELECLELLEEPFKSMFDAENVRNDRVLHWLMRSVMPVPEEAQKLADHGIVLIGDAVHAMPILMGEGANMAIKDGINLAEHILSKGLGGIRSFSTSNYDMWRRTVLESEKRLKMYHAPKLYL